LVHWSYQRFTLILAYWCQNDISSTPASGQYWNYRWQLFDTAGNTLFNTYQNTDAEVTASITGDYYLYLQGGADSSKIDYNFHVFAQNNAAPDIITPGTGTGSTGADNLRLFNVKLGATDSRGASSTQDYQVKLWADPNNTNPIITSPAVTKFALADKGYRYQLTSIDADGDNVIYQLLEAPTGAVIDKDTGELLWIPATTIQPGDKANFKVQVNDKRGGTDTQTFTVDVFGNLGTIQGAVFDDLNSNGLRDTKLIKGNNPAIVLAIDVSGSTIAPFYGTSRSKTVQTVLAAEIAAAELMIDSVRRNPPKNRPHCHQNYRLPTASQNLLRQRLQLRHRTPQTERHRLSGCQQ
jgi:large repetitive protein